jgi:hypothetical protein
MSPFLFDADLAVTELGSKRRATTTVADAHIASLFADYADARKTGRMDVAQLVLDHAYAIDPGLVDELAGFDYPAAA